MGLQGGCGGCALDALACDGGVGRDRISIAPGSVTFGDGVGLCVGARDSHLDSVGMLGAADGLHARVSRGVTADAWGSARANVLPLMSSRGSVSLDQIARVGSSLS